MKKWDMDALQPNEEQTKQALDAVIGELSQSAESSEAEGSEKDAPSVQK